MAASAGRELAALFVQKLAARRAAADPGGAAAGPRAPPPPPAAARPPSAGAAAALEAKAAAQKAAAAQNAQAVQAKQEELDCLVQAKEELQARLAVSASAVEELEARVVQLGRDLGTAQAESSGRLKAMEQQSAALRQQHDKAMKEAEACHKNEVHEARLRTAKNLEKEKEEQRKLQSELAEQKKVGAAAEAEKEKLKKTIAKLEAVREQMSTSVTEATRKAAQDTAAVEERLAEVQRDLQEERRKAEEGAAREKVAAEALAAAERATKEAEERAANMSAAWTEAAAAAEEQLALLQFELQGERGKAEQGAAGERALAEALAAAEQAAKKAKTDLDIANTQLALWKDNAATLNLPPVNVGNVSNFEEQMELERLRTTSAALQQELGKLRRQVAQHKAAFETARKGGEELGKRAAEQAAAQQLEGLRSELRESQEGRQRTNEKAGALERQLTEAQQAAAQQLEGLRSELRESQDQLRCLRTTSAALQQELGELRQQVAQHKAAVETARKGGEELGKRAAEQAAAQQLEGLRSELRESQEQQAIVTAKLREAAGARDAWKEVLHHQFAGLQQQMQQHKQTAADEQWLQEQLTVAAAAVPIARQHQEQLTVAHCDRDARELRHARSEGAGLQQLGEGKVARSLSEERAQEELQNASRRASGLQGRLGEARQLAGQLLPAPEAAAAGVQQQQQEDMEIAAVVAAAAVAQPPQQEQQAVAEAAAFDAQQQQQPMPSTAGEQGQQARHAYFNGEQAKMEGQKATMTKFFLQQMEDTPGADALILRYDRDCKNPQLKESMARLLGGNDAWQDLQTKETGGCKAGYFQDALRARCKALKPKPENKREQRTRGS